VGGKLLAIIIHTLLQVLRAAKICFHAVFQKIDNHANVILYRKNLLKTVEIAINGCI
jgi:hypothetical protein